jgi:hypothetical protein
MCSQCSVRCLSFENPQSLLIGDFLVLFCLVLK